MKKQQFELSSIEKIQLSDFIIIGSGLAAVVFAQEVLNKGYTVSILEKGKNDCHKEDLYITGKKFGIEQTRCVGIGGTSNLWANVISPLDEEDFEHWPLDCSEFKKHYIKANKYLNVEFEPFLKFTKQVGDITVIDNIVNTYLKAKVFFQSPKPTRSREMLEVLSDSASLYYGVELEELVLCKKINQITEIVVSVGENLYKIDVKGKNIIVAAGALASPGIFLNSSNLMDRLEQLGSAEQVGRNLMDHPMGNLGQLYLNQAIDIEYFNRVSLSNGTKIKFGMIQNNGNFLNHNFYHIPSFKKGYSDRSEKVKRSILSLFNRKIRFSDVFNIITSPRVAFQVVSYFVGSFKKYDLYDLWFVCEQLPQAHNRVYLSSIKKASGYKKTSVFWSLTKSELEEIKEYLEYLSKVHPLAKNNTGEIINKPSVELIESRLTSASHHAGTLRMAEKYSQGVVDTSLQVNGVEKLYVLDASVIPRYGNANPNYTIVALSCYLSSHFDDKINPYRDNLSENK